MSYSNEENFPTFTDHLTMLVPELLFDISSKIVPGITLSLWYAVILLGPLEVMKFIEGFLKMNTGVTEDAFIILIGSSLSFALSILLWSQYYLIDKVWKRSGGISGADDENRVISVRDIAFKCDYIRLQNNSVGNRIAKLQSEIQMSEVFFIGLCYGIIFIIWAYCTAVGVGAQQDPGVYCVGLISASLAGIVGSFLCHARLSQNMESTIDNFYELLGGTRRVENGNSADF